MNKKYVLISIFMFCLSVCTPAYAGWTGCKLLDNNCVDYEIADIFGDIEKANKSLKDNRPVMLQFLDQQQHWKDFQDNTILITESIEDVFENLPQARAAFIKFTGQPKCGKGTACYDFRTDLLSFFGELDALKPSFPALQRAGLQDLGAVQTAIYNTPPFVLYAMYRAQQNIPDWQNLPTDLKNIFDELGDPEIFHLDLNKPTAAFDISPASSSASTRTQQFCSSRASKLDGVDGNHRGSDQIRINRIILTVTLLTDVWKFALDQVPDDIDIGVSLVGEGGVIGIPSAVFTWFFKIVPLASESILKAIEVHHKNLDLCKSRFGEIESRLASCDYRTEFVLNGVAREEYYELVERRFEMATVAQVSLGKATRFRNQSRTKENGAQFKQAFELLCESYQSIGIN